MATIKSRPALAEGLVEKLDGTLRYVSARTSPWPHVRCATVGLVCKRLASGHVLSQKAQVGLASLLFGARDLGLVCQRKCGELRFDLATPRTVSQGSQRCL